MMAAMPITVDPSAARPGAHPCPGGRRSRVAPDDTCLRARFDAGDESALDEVYRRYSPQLLVIGVRRLGDRDLASEAVQQAFVQAWRAASKYDPSRALCAVAVRHHAAGLRRHVPPGPPRPRLCSTTASCPTAAGPAAGELFEQVWRARLVRRAVDALPAPEHDVVRLTYLSDLTFAQAADRLDVPIGTVKSRSYRAHRRLAEVLAGFDDLSDRVA